MHGDRLVDDYHWLRNRDNPAVRAYLEAENAYAEAVLAPTKPLQEQLYQEMLSRIKQTDLSVPYREGEFWYYTRTEEGKQYPIHCRKRGMLNAGEEVLLDLNLLAEGRSYLAVGVLGISPDGRLLAYSLDVTGSREYTLWVKDLETQALVAGPLEHAGSMAWAADNRTFFYTVEDAARRQYRVYRHRLGGRSELTYEEADQRFRVAVAASRSRRFVLLEVASHTSSEVRVLAATEPDAAWRLVAPRAPEREYDLDHHGDRFFIRVNDTGRNFRVVTAPVDSPGPEHWVEVLPHRDTVMVEGIDCFAGHWVAWEREAGLPKIRVAALDTGAVRYVGFAEPAYEAYPATNRQWDTTALRYGYESLVTPTSVFEYDVATGGSTLLKQREVLGGYQPAQYRSERLHAAAEDGTPIPISLVCRRDLPAGPRALLLEGYGAYGIPFPVTFSSNRLSLLDRGVVIALAHVRGGGELGRPWHDQGRMARKETSFRDFIAVARFLIGSGRTAPDRLGIEGGSAGGLLMGAVLNRAPELFRAAVLQVPFVDVINTMLDPSLPLTVGEYEEWGNPAIPEEYRVLRAYCPYTNLARQAYPAMLVRTSFHDSQVMYWEPVKYVAKLRTLKTDSNPLLLTVNFGAGHVGASGRYDRLREVAVDYAFMLDQLGLRA